jgi:hypothetical protein
MRLSTLLRLAAIVALLQFAAHGAMFVRAKPTHGTSEIAVVQAMKEHQFDFGGAKRSYWDMYFGYGLEAAFICLVEAVLFWQLAGFAAVAPAAVKPIAALFLVANLAHAVLVIRYFFIVPLFPDVLISGLLGWVLARAPT